MRAIIFILCLLYPTLSWGQGLLFQRDFAGELSFTTYDVFLKENPVFEDEFSIDFDIEIYDYHTVGNILRVRNLNSREKKNDYIFAYSYCDEENSYFKFNIDTKESRIADTLSNNHLGVGRWYPVSVRFNLQEDCVEVQVAGRNHRSNHLGLDHSMKPDIAFGSTKYSEKFAAFSIRNLKIGNKHKSYSFPLNEQEGEAVHDSNKKIVGVQHGGQWLINKSFHWVKKMHYASESVAAINFDTLSNEVIILNRDSLIRYTPSDDKLAAIAMLNPMPIHARLGTNYYDSASRQMCVYEVNNLPINDLTAAQLDLSTLHWTKLSQEYLEVQRHHHVGFYDGLKAKYTIFGGFGNRRYLNDFVSFDSHTGHWAKEKFEGDTIYPRFATSLGRLGSEDVLIYGGVGNETGDEIVGVIYYDDLYKVNLDNHRIERLWRHRRDNYNMVPVRNLYVSDDSRYFYTLCYPIMEPRTYLKLYKISIADGSRVQLGDSIAVKSISILSNFNLYCSNDRNEMYCVAQEFVDDNRSNISIYSISTPVVSSAELQYYKTSNFSSWFWGALGTLLLAIFAYYTKKRQRERSRKQTLENDIFAGNLTPSRVTKNALYLFGDFQAYDRSGRDITYLFSNIIRQLLVLMIIHSYKNEDGISSSALSEALWPDKDNHCVKNIKGVTVYNLRQILKEVDGVEILYEDNKYRVLIVAPFYCDYYEYTTICETLSDSDISNEAACVLSNLIMRGKFLQGFLCDVYDGVKSRFENEVTTLLPVQIAAAYSAHNFKLVLVLTSILLQVDSYNEVALRYELHALLKFKQVEQSKRKFYQFKISYLKNMGEEYPLSYNAIVDEEPDVVSV